MRNVILIAAALTVAGCALTPDYRRSEKALVSQASVQGKFAANATFVSTDEPSRVPWWHLYSDPLLDQLVSDALINNNDLKVAAANLARANANVSIAADARLPQLATGAEFAYARDSAEEQLVAGPLDNHRVYAAIGSVSYQVDLFGQVKRAIEEADANADAAKSTLASTRIAVAAQTVAAYLTICSVGREILVTRHAIDLQGESTQLARRRYELGRAPSLDVTRSITQENQLRASLPPLVALRVQALNRLTVLSGNPVQSLPGAVSRCEQEPSILQPIPVGDGRGLLARRPDIAEAEAMVRSAYADLGVATADLYPSITFGASGGSVGLWSHAGDDDTYKFSVGPLLTWHFPNRQKARATIHRAQAGIDAAEARFDKQVLIALEEVQVALSDYAQDLSRMTALQEAQRSADKSSKDARALYTAGRDNYLSVLDADRQLASTDQMVAAQQTRIANDQVQLFLALGGGWESLDSSSSSQHSTHEGLAHP